jgi:hypothetical protein
MVRAILDGTKTQTRRIVKLKRGNSHAQHRGPLEWKSHNDGTCAATAIVPQIDRIAETPKADLLLLCPYGQPGDRLWVRETFRQVFDTPAVFQYRADNHDDSPLRPKWKPSIFCTRVASRITLEIAAVNVERIQAITEADATAEGTPAIQTAGEVQSDGTIKPLTLSARFLFMSLWTRINGPGSWDANPWAWVITFKRITP